MAAPLNKTARPYQDSGHHFDEGYDHGASRRHAVQTHPQAAGVEAREKKEGEGDNPKTTVTSSTISLGAQERRGGLSRLARSYIQRKPGYGLNCVKNLEILFPCITISIPVDILRFRLQRS